MAITWCRPLGMEPSLVTASDPASTDCKVPVALPAGVPATKSVEPLSRATVAPVIAPGAVGPATGVSTTGCTAGRGLKVVEPKSTSITAAPGRVAGGLPGKDPHSAPQLRMKALVSLPLKTAV